MRGVGKEIELLGLPGPQPFGEIADELVIKRRRKLLRVDGGVCGLIESFGSNDGRGLVVAMILSVGVIRQPGDDHLGLRQAHVADGPREHRTMVPGFERNQRTLACGVFASQKPHVHNPQRSQRAASFNFPHRAQ